MLGAVFVTPRCDEFGLKTLQKRWLDQDMAIVFKLTQEGHNQVGLRTRQTEANNGLTAQFSRTDQRKYSFAVRKVEQWNL